MTAAEHVPSPSVLTEISGWGRNLRADCRLLEPESEGELRHLLDPSGCIARGLGRSYGDPALNAGGTVLGMRRLDRYIAFDPAEALLTCEAGVSLAQIIDDFGPRGFFPMITPGTKYVTVGGAIANDVHGKAHHVQGCFSACVESMRVLVASGEVLEVSRKQHPDLFWATFGGMGLLGIVLTASIRLRPIETTYFHQRAFRTANLDEMLSALEENDAKYPYSVAYVDPVATGARLGGGVLTVGDHASLADLPPELAQKPLHISPGPRVTVPFELPELTLNTLSISLGNVVLKEIQGRAKTFAHYEKFFYPLDAIGHWNRGYGKRGFTQYQFVIPFADGRKKLHEILTAITSSGELPFLNVLKRFGHESGGTLSFPREGYTFAIDFPIRDKTVELTRRLDQMVLDAGGRIYLGKDSYVTPEMLRAMYGQAVEQFLAVKAKYDPNNMFTSDLGRRVGLS